MQMQQQQPPVFKPLNSSEGSTSLFSFDPSRSRTCQNNNATFQIARPNEMQSQATKMSQQKEQNIGQERLSSLHAKLHQEADKIRKWKVQSEIELKQKEKKIQEASTTVESLRKSILELQLQNENLSLKLKEEMDHREDILNKIHCTRDLCNILKTHTTQMEEKLEQCETEKTELKYLGKEHQEQFEELSKQFQKLELSSVENHNKLMNQLNLERDERVKVEKDMEDKLSNAEEDLKNLIDQCDEKDIEIREVRSRLQKNDETIHTYEQDIEISKQKVENLNTELSEKDIKLQGLFDELNANLEEKNVLEIKINNIEIELQDSKSTIDKMEQVMSSNQTKFDASIDVLQRELESTRLQLEQTKLLIKEMEVKMVEGVSICENLKSSRDVLIMEKSELEARISQQEHTLENIKGERDSMREELHKLQTQLNLTTSEMAEKCTIFEELQAVNKNLQDRISDYEISSKIMENTIQTQKKHLDTREEVISEGIVKEEEYIYKLKEMNMETEQLLQKLNKECDINEELRKSLKESKAEGQSKEKDLVAKEKEINKLKKEMEKRDIEKQNLTEEIEVIQEDLSQLRIKQESLEQEIIQLTQENDRLQKQYDKTDKNWNNERETKTKKMSELESKQKELKSDIVSKNKQIKELEKELKTTKSKLTTQTKSAADSTSEIERMSKELEMLKTTEIDLEEKLQAATDNEVKVSSKLRTELADIKNQLHQAVKDKTDSIGRSDAQIAEMMATLQKYKMENQKIVDQKEKELDSLRMKLDQSSNVKEKNSKLCDDFKKETDELKRKIDDLEKEKRNLSQSSNSDSKKIKELQLKLDKKEKEIKELTTKVSTPKEKAESQTICTQTSPKPIQKIFKEITTPLRKTFIPSTPKVHPTYTPRTVPKTPVDGNMTPQRSILRDINSVSKKRRVAFIPEDEKHDSDSSSSELMEVEPEDLERYKKGNATPVHIRPSPRTPLTESNNAKKMSMKTPPLHRVPRGPAVKPKQPSLKGFLENEKDQFKTLFPNKESQQNNKNQKSIRATPTARTPVNKPPRAKFFSVSPKLRKELHHKSDKVEDMAWFDLDSVFGFGPED